MCLVHNGFLTILGDAVCGFSLVLHCVPDTLHMMFCAGSLVQEATCRTTSTIAKKCESLKAQQSTSGLIAIYSFMHAGHFLMYST